MGKPKGNKTKGSLQCLVTGGAGFIGSHLCEHLLERNLSVTVLDNLSTGCTENINHLLDNRNFRFIRDSVLNRSLINKLVAGSDIVYHLAAAVGVKYILDNPVTSMLTNLKGTEFILEFAHKHGRKVIFTSTSEVYGKHIQKPMQEDDDRVLGSTAVSRWGYADAKATDELLALAYAREKNLAVVIVRLFNTVGPRQVGDYGMVLPRLIRQALRNEPLTIYGSGQQIRSFIFVTDAVRAIIDLSLTAKAEGKVLNIGQSQPTTIEDLAKKIIRITGSGSEIKYVSYAEAYGPGFEEMTFRTPDISRLKKTIRYASRYKLNDIIKMTVEYFREQAVC